MTEITIPDEFEKLILEFDGFRRVWIAWAIVGGYWYKGLSASRGEAFDALCAKIAIGHHVAKLEPSKYVKTFPGTYRSTLQPEALAALDGIKLDL